MQKEDGISFSTEEYSSGRELLNNWRGSADIVLLDIRMGDPDGFETAKRLRSYSFDGIIIFITSLPQFALKSYEVRAFGFLPKPVTYGVFKNDIMQAIAEIKRKNPQQIIIKDKDRGIQRNLYTNEIVYVESNDHDITIITEKEMLNYSGTMNTLLASLAPYGFFRCHSSYIVNARYIDSIDKQSLLLRTGDTIPLSRTRKKEFMEALTAWLGGSNA